MKILKVQKPLARRRNIEAEMAFSLRALRVPFEREVRFAPGRKYRADFHISGTNILLECEGLMPEGKGGHNSVLGVARDIEKYNLAALLGYVVLRCHNKRGAGSVGSVALLAQRLFLAYNKT